ncbi:LapA family protein [bacterium]|nr:LapA family protein [bacterium]
MSRWKLYVALVLVVLSGVVVLQNTATVETRFLFATIAMPRAALLAVTWLVGVASGILLMLAFKGKAAPKQS